MDKANFSKLSEDVKFLGTMLGEIIKEQEGIWLFELEEQVRLTSIAMHEENSILFYNELNKIFAGKNNNDLELLIRAFTTYFFLVNLAENVHRARRLRAHELDNSKDGNKNSLIGLFEKLNLQSNDIPGFIEFLKNIDIVLITHEHPDHTNGLWDLSHIYLNNGRAKIKIIINPKTAAKIRHLFFPNQ